MSYDNEPEPIYEREERRSLKEDASAEKFDQQRENAFYCYGEETIGTAVKCREQCDKCIDIETHLQK